MNKKRNVFERRLLSGNSRRNPWENRFCVINHTFTLMVSGAKHSDSRFHRKEILDGRSCHLPSQNIRNETWFDDSLELFPLTFPKETWVCYWMSGNKSASVSHLHWISSSKILRSHRNPSRSLFYENAEYTRLVIWNFADIRTLPRSQMYAKRKFPQFVCLLEACESFCCYRFKDIGLLSTTWSAAEADILIKGCLATSSPPAKLVQPQSIVVNCCHNIESFSFSF